MQWIENICRICGEINEITHSLFSDSSNDLPNKIKKCLNIQVFKDDYKPKQLCNKCAMKLNDFCEFQTISYETNEKFEAIYTVWLNRRDWDEENTIVNCTQQKFSVIVNPRPTIDLPLDSNLLPNTDYNLDYLNVENTDRNNQENTVLRHSSNYCQVETSPVKKVQKNRKLKEFKCPNCTDKVFRRRTTLNNHIAINHTKLRPFVCDMCQKSYATKCDLTNHQKIHTDQYKCTFCQRTFSAPSKLKRHIRIHTNDKPFICNYKNCGKSFSDKRNLDGHKSVHLNVFNFKCTECDRAFKANNRLKQHMKIHDLVRSNTFICEICSKSYKYRSNLVLHLRKHNGYFCPYCRKDCERIVMLNKHKKVCLMRK